MSRKMFMLQFICLIFFASFLISWADSPDNLIKKIDNSNWFIFTNDTGKAKLTSDNNQLVVAITNPGKKIWSIGIGQLDILLENEYIYSLSFNAKSDTPIRLRALLQLQKEPYLPYTQKYFFKLPTK